MSTLLAIDDNQDNLILNGRKRTEERQELVIEVLELLNQSDETTDTIRDLLLAIKSITGFEAVGIRLKEGEDFPYYETSGFPSKFVETERFLCARDQTGELVRDSEGNPYLECMCGNILCGRTNPLLPFFTEHGSFWTNSTSQLLASTTEEDRQARTRNRCNGEGYESVALIPLRSANDIIGLLQLNDYHCNMFTPEFIRFLEGIGLSIGIVLDRKRAEESLLKRTHELGERVKELNCLYEMSNLVEKPGVSLEKILQGTVDLIPLGWQYPEITCVRVSFDSQEFRTEHFQETLWKQTSDILVHGGRRGVLEVCYLEEKPESDEGPFLKEERNLINAITQRLGRIIERLLAEEALRKSEQQYRLLAENVADGIGIIQEGKLVFVNDALASTFGYPAVQLIGKSLVDLFHHTDRALFRKMSAQLEQGSPEPQNWPVLQRVVKRDDREVWMERRYSPTTWEGQPAILINLRDITKRKLREMEIERERNTLQRENIQLRATIKERYRFGNIIGKSQVMQDVYELILKASASEKDVLIGGESGTGKELIARTIHQLSARQAQAFVPVNCGAVPESLFEREFFGHRKGAFTGAVKDTQGYFDAAHQGTLFLDEVGELSPAMQVKLLRTIENGEYTPVGEAKPSKVNIRIITASNRNLADQVEKGVMREDFFYRIHIIVIDLPALRERREDIPLLIDHFVQQYGDGTSLPEISGAILETLYNYDWPGNIRQLRNVLYRYLTVGRLDFSGPRSAVPGEKDQSSNPEFEPDGPGLHEMRNNFEKQMIIRMLEQHRWHRGNTAARLHIDPKTLYRKMKQYRLI